MNRIAFRIYDPEKKKFHYSGSTPSMLAGYFKNTATLVTIHGMEHQQGTSLHDKTGREIYEGDIVRCKKYIGGKFVEYCYEFGYVEFVYGAFGLHRRQGFYRPFKDWLEDYEFEVIGNIYQNGDLLDEVKPDES